MILKLTGVSKLYSRQEKLPVISNIKNLGKLILGQKISKNLTHTDFFALSNICLEIKEPQVLGVIGPNGAGKTTLMKIISKLILSDKGSVEVNGKVQSMLSLTAGFNDKLTGYENVITGLKLRGMSDVSDTDLRSIFEFSGVKDFMDMPLGTYSSGMKSRLGFSMNVFTRPDIMIIDEALSVGDESFKLKCRSKLEELKNNNMTIILVSHSLNTVRQFCDRVIYIDKGVIKKDGEPDSVIQYYLSTTKKNDDIKYSSGIYGHECDNGQTSQVKVTVNPSCINLMDDLQINISFYLKSKKHNLNCSLPIYHEDGRHITTLSTLNVSSFKKQREGHVSFTWTLKCSCLNPGNYLAVLCIHEGFSYLLRKQMASFSVNESKDGVWGIVTMDSEYDE